MKNRIRASVAAFVAVCVALVSVQHHGVSVRKAHAADTALTAVIAGGLYAASGSGAGFMSAADFSKLSAYPAVSGLTTGQLPRATGAASIAFGPLDLANGTAVTGTLPVGNIPTGSSSSNVCIGNDSRLSNARAPDGTAFTTDQSFASHKGTLVADGSADTDVPAFGQLNRQSSKQTCTASTTAALPACTYANGTSGVGATLTGNSNGALAAQDGQTLAAGLSLFVRFQTAPEQNGRYDVTAIGDGSHPFALTRSTDADTAAKLRGSLIAVAKGTIWGGTLWELPLKTSDITVGTTALTWVGFISASGLVPFTGDQSFGSHKITSLTNGSAATDAMAFGQFTFTTVNALLAAASADISVNSHKLTNVTDPTSAQNAATKNYVDTKPRLIWLWGAASAAGATATKWLASGNHGTGISGTQSQSNVMTGVAVTATDIYCNHDAALSTDSVAYTLDKAGVDTAIACTIAGAGTACHGTGSVAIVATDVLQLKSVQSSTQAGAAMAPRCVVVGTG